MFNLELWDLSVGFVTCLVLVNLFPKLSLAGGWIVQGAVSGYRWFMTKIGRGSAMIAMVAISMTLLLLQGFACAKVEADAYICGEPPDEVTFYCKVGTGPPREDCSAPQTGEFDGIDPITC